MAGKRKLIQTKFAGDPMKDIITRFDQVTLTYEDHEGGDLLLSLPYNRFFFHSFGIFRDCLTN